MDSISGFPSKPARAVVAYQFYLIVLRSDTEGPFIRVVMQRFFLSAAWRPQFGSI